MHSSESKKKFSTELHFFQINALNLFVWEGLHGGYLTIEQYGIFLNFVGFSVYLLNFQNKFFEQH